MSSLSLPAESFDKLNLRVALQVEIAYLNSVYCMFFCPTFYVGWFGGWKSSALGSSAQRFRQGQQQDGSAELRENREPA